MQRFEMQHVCSSYGAWERFISPLLRSHSSKVVAYLLLMPLYHSPSHPPPSHSPGTMYQQSARLPPRLFQLRPPASQATTTSQHRLYATAVAAKSVLLRAQDRHVSRAALILVFTFNDTPAHGCGRRVIVWVCFFHKLMRRRLRSPNTSSLLPRLANTREIGHVIFTGALLQRVGLQA